MLRPVRRVVTGHDADGKSIVLYDGIAQSILANPDRPGRGLTDLWVTETAPADNAGEVDTADRRIRLEPPGNGTVFRFFQVMPESEEAGIDAAEVERRTAAGFKNIGAAHSRVDTSRHPGMHKTATVDYIILLSGRVTMILDDGEVDLEPLDVVVQRGTNHAWINHGTEPAVLAGVLVAAEPV